MGKKTGILGAGGWGITIARMLDDKGIGVMLWEPIKENFRSLEKCRESKVYFPGFKIPRSIAITGSLDEILSESDILLLAVRSTYFRDTVRNIRKLYRNQPVIIATKGMETASGKRMSQILAEEISGDIPFGVLSGPTIARELAAGMPSAAVIATPFPGMGITFQKMLNCDTLRIYTSADVAGVETGGAFKNVIAIGSGIIDGLGLGINTKASYLTRGLNEMIRIGCILGGKEKTFRGLSGLGDLITTSFSRHSRNRSFGEALAGADRDDYIGKSKMVIEGIPATKAFYGIGRKMSVELPITSSLYNIVFAKADPGNELARLMRRKAGEE